MDEIRRFEPHRKTLVEIAAFLGASVTTENESIEITGISSNSQAINEANFSSRCRELRLTAARTFHPLWSVVRGRYSPT
jgi:hypothetical protein